MSEKSLFQLSVVMMVLEALPLEEETDDEDDDVDIDVDPIPTGHVLAEVDQLEVVSSH